VFGRIQTGETALVNTSNFGYFAFRDSKLAKSAKWENPIPMGYFEVFSQICIFLCKSVW
jgi:hypothetical protein